MEYRDDIDRIYHEWDNALANNDVEALLKLYSPQATLESPLVPHLMNSDCGVCSGEKQLRKLFEVLASRKPSIRKYYRTGYFTDGKRLIWEYPRLTPDDTEQMDFVEVMDIENGLIQNHRVYWGWRGIKVMKDDEYYK